MRKDIAIGAAIGMALSAIFVLSGTVMAQDGIDVVPETMTFAFLLTAAGTGIAGALVTGTVALIKAVWEAMPVSGAAAAFVVSLILYVIAAVATESWRDLNMLLIVFVSWLTCASAAVGVNQVLAKRAITA